MASDGEIKIRVDLDSNKAQSAMSKFSSIAKSGLKGVEVAVKAVGTAMTALAGYSIKVGSDFEAGMSKVSAISGATGEDLEALSDKAKEMGAKTKFSATEAAEAFEYMAMAGWKTEDMLSGIEGVMNLAAASGEDLATTSDIVTDALTAFGLEASDSAHFADVLAAASTNANTNVSMMGETFKYVAPVAGSLGFSAEDCAVAIGLMANSGIKASQAGTSLRQIFTNLVKPTNDMQEAMDQLGISLTDSAGNTKSLDTLMGDLRQSFSGLTEAEKTNYAATLAGQEGMSGFLAIVNASDADFKKLKSSIYDCDGATEKMAETMQDNLQGSLTIMKSALEGFGIKIYENMQEPLKEAADKGTESINRLSSAFDSGGLKGVVKEVGEIFGDLTDDIAGTSDAADGLITPLKNLASEAVSLGKTALPKVADAAETLAENMDIVLPVVTACTAGVKVYAATSKKAAASTKANAAATKLLTKMEKENMLQSAAINGKLTVRQTLMAVNNGQITVATAKTGLWTKAQMKLNAALTSNPIGLVVAATAALVAGMVAVTIATKDATEKLYGLNEEQRKSVDACNESTEKLNEQRAAREESVQSIEREYDGYEALLSELQAITDENGNVKAGYEDRAAVITGQLSDALGTEIELLDGQIQKYGEVVQAIDEVIVKKKAEAVLNSMQEDMANAYANTEEAINKYKEASAAAAEKTKAVEEAQKEADAAQQRFKDSAGQSTDVIRQYSEECREANDKLKAAKKAQEEASEAAKNSKTAMEELSTELDRYNALQEAFVSGDVARIEDALNNLVTSYQKYTGEALAESEETRSALYSQAQGYVENLGLIQDGTIKVSDEIYAQMADAAAKTIENFNQLPGGIAQGIEDIGPEAGAAMISALAQADLDGKLSEESKASYDAFMDGLDALPEGTRQALSDAVEGALQGMEGFDEISQKAEEEGISFLDALREALDEHSPSKATEEIFQLAMEGASNGVESGKEGILTKAGEAVSAFLGKFTESGMGETLYNAGASMMSFFGIGVSSQQENSRLAGKANADAANAGASSVDSTGAGSRFGMLFGSGIGGMFGSLIAKGKELADNAKSGAGSVNPTEAGGKFGTQYASGVGSKKETAKSKGKELADNAKSGAGTADGYSIGSNFGSGFVSGIGSWIKSAADKAAELAKSALNAAKRALDSHSPSKKAAKIGRTVPQGLGVGIDEDTDVAVKAAEEMSENTLNALDTDSLARMLKNVDVPDIMSRVYFAVDDKQDRVSERITAPVVAKEKARTLEENNSTNKALDIDYKKLGKEMSKRPIVVSTKLNGRELIKETAVPMYQEIKGNNNFKSALKGVRS